MNKSDSIVELAKAMAKAQGEMGGAIKGKDNPFFKSSYADLGAVIQAIKEPFANNGISYTQFPIESDGRVGVETVLMHESGEWMSERFTVPLSKQDAQGAGSALTYCRRYALQAVAGVPSEDDDGNAASNFNPDLDFIKDAIKRNDSDWVNQNWSGLIAAQWANLNQAQTTKLNNMFNG